MSQSDCNKESTSTSLESSIQQLTLHPSSATGEDWDRSVREERPEPPAPLNGTQTSKNETTSGSNFGTRGKKSLGEMLRMHMEKGQSLNLSDEEEENLSEELGKWINSDSSPYELDDAFFPPEKNESTRGRSNSIMEKPRDTETESSSPVA